MGHRGAVYGSAIDAEARRVVTASGDYTAKVWNALSGACLTTWTHPHYVKCCDWRRDKVVTGCFDGNVRVYDPEHGGGDPGCVFRAHGSVIKAVYVVESQWVLTACEETLRVWDLRSPKTSVHETKIGDLNGVEYVEMYQPVVLGAHKQGVTLLDPRTLSETHRITSGEDVECASLSPGGKHVVMGTGLKVKECRLDGTELRSHRGHHGPVFHIRYSPVGDTYASGSEDGMVRVWPTNEVIESHLNGT